MHVVAIAYGPTNTVWQFYFATRERAERVNNEIVGHMAGKVIEGAGRANVISFTDDYGQTGTVRPGLVHGTLLRDSDAVAEAEIALQAMGMRNNIDAQQQAQGAIVRPGLLRQ